MLQGLFRALTAIVVAGGLSLSAMPVLADEIVGIFQTEDGTQDYEVTLCGDGTQLCGRLVGLHGAEDNATARQYLGTYIVKNLRKASENVWKGTITFKDKSANGSVTINPGKDLIMSGCAYIFFCANIRLVHVS
jgi:uncharacterized protein (DUF2147 family)